MDVNDDMGCLEARVVLAFFASKLRSYGGSRSLQTRQCEAAFEPTWLADRTHSPVGASGRRSDLPAMIVNDDAGCLNARVVRAFFASKLRSYGGSRSLQTRQCVAAFEPT